MNTKEKFELGHWVVGLAQKQGADQASVNISNSRDVEISHREGKIEQLKESTRNSLALDIYANKRYSGHTTNDLRRETLEKFVAEAVAMTRYLNEDPYRGLPEKKYYENQQNIDLKLVDGSYGGVDSNARIRMARELEENGKAYSDKIVSVTGEYGDTLSESVKINSNGFEGAKETTTFWAGASVTVDDGNGGRPADWCYSVNRRRDKLLSAEMLGTDAARRAVAKIGQGKIKSGRYHMIVENRAGSRLIGALQRPLSGRALQQRQSIYEDKVGKKIASERLTLYDDPFVVGGLGSCVYDGEGMTTKKRAIIEKGFLKDLYIDTYYGRKLGKDPTGGAVTNMTFAYGEKSLAELVKQMDTGILVTGFLGGNSNSTTGDFSYGIIGMYVEHGEPVKPVNEMNISGNLQDFWMQLAEMGNDVYDMSSWRRSSMLFTDVEFSGI